MYKKIVWLIIKLILYFKRPKLVKIFYIGASMKQFYPQRGGYLGLHITNFGDEQRKSILRLFKACEGLPVEITFKPHNYEGEAWIRFLKSIDTKVKWKLKKWNDNFNRLLINCDFAVMSHWSTAIIEANYASKFNIVMDWFNSQDLAPYTKFYTTVVRSEEELRREILKHVNSINMQKKLNT